MGASTPEELDELYVAAYRARDAEAVADLYEEDALYAMSIAGQIVQGRDAIREAVNQTFAVLPEVELVYDSPERAFVSGDWAFVHGTTRTRFTLGDGTQHETVARASTVRHRGADGNWRLVVDHAST